MAGEGWGQEDHATSCGGIDKVAEGRAKPANLTSNSPSHCMSNLALVRTPPREPLKSVTRPKLKEVAPSALGIRGNLKDRGDADSGEGLTPRTDQPLPSQVTPTITD
jgi:hypothetical protein